MKWFKRRGNETYRDFDKRSRRVELCLAWGAVAFLVIALLSLAGPH